MQQNDLQTGLVALTASIPTRNPCRALAQVQKTMRHKRIYPERDTRACVSARCGLFVGLFVPRGFWHINHGGRISPSGTGTEVHSNPTLCENAFVGRGSPTQTERVATPQGASVRFVSGSTTNAHGGPVAGKQKTASPLRSRLSNSPYPPLLVTGAGDLVFSTNYLPVNSISPQQDVLWKDCGLPKGGKACNLLSTILCQTT